MAANTRQYGDHDAALRDLLLQQVQQTHTAINPAATSHSRTAERSRWRAPLTTTLVAAAVIAASVAALNLHVSPLSTPAQSGTPTLPIPDGRIVKTLSDTSGPQRQTFTLNTDGTAFKLVLACTGGKDNSQVLVRIPGHGETAVGCGEGLTTGGDSIDPNSGNVPITVTASDPHSHWRLDFITTEPTARGYTYTPAPTAPSS